MARASRATNSPIRSTARPLDCCAAASGSRRRASARSKVGSKIAKGAKATKKAVRSAAKKVAGKVRRGGRRLVSFYDRAAIEDGVLKGRNLEIVYLKDPVELVLHPDPGFGARAARRTAR